MKFENAMNYMSGLIDYYYEEHCGSGQETEDYKKLEKAETTLELLINHLKNIGVFTLKDAKQVMVNKWNDINKQKPAHPGRYLTSCKVGLQPLVCVLYFNGECFLEEEVTHWMPLPNSAKEE